MLRAYARESNNAAAWHRESAEKSFYFNVLDGAAYSTDKAGLIICYFSVACLMKSRRPHWCPPDLLNHFG